MDQPRPLSVYFSFVSNQKFYRIKTVNFCRIRTRIVGIEGKHADHLTNEFFSRITYIQQVGFVQLN